MDIGAVFRGRAAAGRGALSGVKGPRVYAPLVSVRVHVEEGWECARLSTFPGGTRSTRRCH